MTYDTNTYRRLAHEQGLGELSDVELYYIEAQDAYNYYAAGPSMSYGMAQDVHETWEEFKTIATPERIASIQQFIKYLNGENIE